MIYYNITKRFDVAQNFLICRMRAVQHSVLDFGCSIFPSFAMPFAYKPGAYRSPVNRWARWQVFGFFC